MFDDLENELARFTPRGPSAGLEERIAAGLAREKFSRGDKWLTGMMSAGAAAAVLIVTLVMTDGMGGGHAGMVQQGGASTVAERPRLLAQMAVRSDEIRAATVPNGGG